MGQDRFKEQACNDTVSKAFEIAMEKMETDGDKETLKGLRQMVQELEHDLFRPKAKYQDAFFFPSKPNVARLCKYIGMAKKSIDLCIFSFTNDDLAGEIIKAHQRGCKVRIITDDESMKGKGADAQRCSDAGIPTRTDDAPDYHMHNKFMVVDSTFLVTGSFNWTFQAGSHNQENIIVVDGEFYCSKYNAEFNNLWAQFSKNELEHAENKAASLI
jgi:mitochondrial cardiolipin hydrolase